MKVVVVGAGGLGSYVGAVLSRAGHDVTLVARGEHLEAIRREGLHVETVSGDFQVRPAAAESGLEIDGADLTLVTVKSYSLDDVAEQVAHLAQGGSLVVSLLNGVTASARLVELGVPGDRMLDGIAYMTAFRTGPATSYGRRSITGWSSARPPGPTGHLLGGSQMRSTEPASGLSRRRTSRPNCG